MKLSNLGGIAVIKAVFHHQTLQNIYGDLLDLSKLLHGPAHFPHQEPNQEVIPAEVVGQRVVKLQVCEEMRAILQRKENDRTGFISPPGQVHIHSYNQPEREEYKQRQAESN